VIEKIRSKFGLADRETQDIAEQAMKSSKYDDIQGRLGLTNHYMLCYPVNQLLPVLPE